MATEHADQTFFNIEGSAASARAEATKSYLEHIPDAKRRREIHIQALKQALNLWHTQAREGIIDQTAYGQHSDRILDKLNSLNNKSNSYV